MGSQLKPRILPSGDAAITVEFSKQIDDDANQRVLALDQALAEARVAGVTETVPTYRSLLIQYDPVVVDFATLSAAMTALADNQTAISRTSRRWRVPVNYGGDNGIDLDDVARTLGLSTDEVIALHTASEYRVAMIGFTPGWSYLSGLVPQLHMPRRLDPRLLTPAGTVSVGGVQSGIQCLAGPSGWHLLGRTAVRTYQISRDPIFLLEPGDAVIFAPVDLETFNRQDEAAARGERVAELIA